MKAEKNVEKETATELTSQELEQATGGLNVSTLEYRITGRRFPGTKKKPPMVSDLVYRDGNDKPKVDLI